MSDRLRRMLRDMRSGALEAESRQGRLDELYVEGSTTPAQWLNIAQGLFGASRATWVEWVATRPRFESTADQRAFVQWMGPVALMLAGMAIEDVLKAALIRAGKPYPHTHNLATLARSLGTTLTADECAVLEDLSVCVTWQGRYPVPKDRKAMRGLYEYSSDYWSAIDAFYLRMGGWTVRPPIQEKGS